MTAPTEGVGTSETKDSDPPKNNARNAVFDPGDGQSDPGFRKDLLRQLWRIIRPQRRLLLGSLLLLLATSACRLAMPYLVKLVIDDVLTAPDPDAGLLQTLLVAFFAIAVSEAIMRRFQQYALDLAGQNALLDLRLRVFRHLQRLPATFYDRTPIGRLVGRVTTDVEALGELFSSGVVTLIGDVVFLVAAVAILVSLSAGLTAATMLMVPVLVIVTVLIRSRVRRAYTKMRSRLSQLNGFLHEQVSGMSTVQLFGRESRSEADLGTINDGVKQAQLASVRWESTLSASTELLGSITTALILWYGGQLALSGMGLDPATDGLATGLTLGTLVAFVDYMQRFFGPLNDLSMKYTVLQNAMVASDRIFSLLDVPPERPDLEPSSPERALPAAAQHAADDGDAPASRGGEIVFENVTFGYHDNQPVLRDVDFRVAAGETVAVVGATGAGKSTLLVLLSRLYELHETTPANGRILLDGVDLAEIPRKELRTRIGVVAQDVFLFRGTILENVTMGHPEITDAEARAACNSIGLDEIVARFPAGYDEPVNERGRNLSAGEKQLIAFARMLVLAPDVLVLDEATSNVDSHTEELLQHAVLRLMEGRTAVLVAHRLSTIRDADRVLVMDGGQLLEQGTHDELLAHGGHYARLHELHLKG